MNSIIMLRRSKIGIALCVGLLLFAWVLAAGPSASGAEGFSAEREEFERSDDPVNEARELRITKTDWNADHATLRVDGERASSGAQVKVTNADTGAELGTVTAKADGKWRLELLNTYSVPCHVRAESGGQTAEKAVKNAPAICDDDDDDDDDDGGGVPGTENIIALHDRSSGQYNKHCSDCHADIHTGQSLDPLIPDAHVAMLPFAAGKTDSDDKCAWCHRSVDLVQAAGSPLPLESSLRKRVDARTCTLCHGPAGPGKQFFQVDLSALQLDGTELYDLFCSGCHRVLADSQVTGESVAEIQEKIDKDEGGMGPLGVLSVDQIQAIAFALAE
ncbi:MAG: carboxypeptidase-like regulatory domain-containing protein [Gammaproteobacteria bacterium]|nr:carboxypeptidase-like regulatory domain-containing protein [Gammaproteobacteria bacterium]